MGSSAPSAPVVLLFVNCWVRPMVFLLSSSQQGKENKLQRTSAHGLCWLSIRNDRLDRHRQRGSKFNTLTLLHTHKHVASEERHFECFNLSVPWNKLTTCIHPPVFSLFRPNDNFCACGCFICTNLKRATHEINLYIFDS